MINTINNIANQISMCYNIAV